MNDAARTPAHDHDLMAVLDRLDSLTDRDHVAVHQVLDRFGASAFLPILMVPALLVTSPLSGIPMFSAICGIVIGLISLQLLVGAQRLWLPGPVLRRRIDGDDLHRAVRKMGTFARWVDRHTQRRLHRLTGSLGQKTAYFACTLGGFAMPLLEIIPFSSSVMGLSVVLLGVGLIAADGFFILLGFAVMGCAAMIPVVVFSGLSGLVATLS